VRKPARVLLWLGQLDPGRPLPQAAEISAEEWSWSQDLAPARRRDYCSSRACLRAWLADLWACAPLAVPLLSPPGEPPRLSGDRAFISLSHSGDGLLLGLSAEPIGVDLEIAARPLAADALMRRFFWLLKEAAIKWRRSSLAAELAEWQLDHGTGQLRQLRLGLEPEGRSGWLGPWGWAAVGAGVVRAQWTQGPGAG
jgi:hypothetical protein